MRLILFITFLLLFCDVFAQQDEIVPITKATNEELTFHKFMNDSVSRVELISIRSSSTSNNYYPRSIIKTEGIQWNHVRLESRLDTSKWEQLITVFETAQPIETGVRLCYEPRNGILFYSKTGEILSYLELCFECNMRRSIGLIRYGNGPNLTDEQYESLKTLFIESGVEIPEPEYLQKPD